MATNRLFAFNNGSVIADTLQYGNLAISDNVVPGYKWWPGPDEDFGYVIAHDDTNPNMRTEGARSATVSTNSIGFWRTSVKTDGDFLTMTNGLFNQGFVTASVAANWLLANGYWTSWVLTYTAGLYKTTYLIIQHTVQTMEDIYYLLRQVLNMQQALLV